MKQLLFGTSRRIGTILSEVDANFIEVCNSILKIVYPDNTLLGYAVTEPETPTTGDCYLVKEDATIWELVCEKNDIVRWDGAAWEKLTYKITELNTALQSLYFEADKIALGAVTGLSATDVQAAIEEITAVLVAEGFIVV